jgi:LysM repeat protein
LDPIDTSTGPKTSAAATRSSRTVAASARSSSDPESPSDEVSSVYQVRRGDTLGGIARRFGVSVQQLRAWNDLPGSRIYPGQRLQIAQ